MAKAPSSQNKTIPIKELSLGMYVTSIKNHDHVMKSEGYISHQDTLDRLHSIGITDVIVDPSKEKHVEKIDKVFSEEEIVPNEHDQATNKNVVSLDDELNKAHVLYKDAKKLQSKLLEKLKQGKSLKNENINETTDPIVDSIFRNQDALSCLSSMQTKDTYLMEHSLNVAILMSIFAKHLGLEKRVIQELALGSFLIDIGKILLPKAILYKDGDLTTKEFNIVKSHVALGLKTLESTPSVSHIAMNIVKEHHERLDGSGYPLKLKGEQISRYGRMVAIVDSFHAMVSERPYEKALSPLKAFKVLLSQSPHLYDEELLEKFIECIGIYPVGTLVKLNSGKLGLISQLNHRKPLNPFVRIFYNTRLNQAIPIEEIDLSRGRYKDQIDRCIRPEEFNINLLGFFKAAFMG